MKKTATLLGIALLLLACGSAITIPGSRLIEQTRQWKEPKVAIWHYTGSSDRYDYFHFHDLNIDQAYRVPTGELTLTQRFPLTQDRSRWVVMPWGPLSRSQGTQ